MPTSRPVFARVYDRLSRRLEARGVADHRRRLLAGLSGTVVEVGAGNGLNLRHYPDEVDAVVAVEPEPHLRAALADAAATAPVPVRIVGAVAEALPLHDGSADAAVASLMLCSVRDQAATLAELHRVLRPGGELRFYEHVRSEHPLGAGLQRAADLVWPALAGGCHTARDTLSAVRAAGFEVTDCERFRFPEAPVPNPAAPHVLGRARRPAA